MRKFLGLWSIYICSLICLAFAIALPGCGSDDTSGSATDNMPLVGTYSGVVSGKSESGTLEITVVGATSTMSLPNGSPHAAPLATGSGANVTGTLFIGGRLISVSGTFDLVTGAFSISGGGYTFMGSFSGGAIIGSYTGPNGGGSFAVLPTAGGMVVNFCGTFDGDSKGVWNLTGVQGGTAVGASTDQGGHTSTLSGTWASGGALSLTASSGGVANGTATGTLMPTGGSGTWQSSDGSDKGTWTTGLCPKHPTDGGVQTSDAGTPDSAAPSDASIGQDAAAALDTGTKPDTGSSDAASDGSKDSSVSPESGSDGGSSDAAADTSVDVSADSGTDAAVTPNDGGSGGSDDATAHDAAIGNDASGGSADASNASDAAEQVDSSAPADATPAEDAATADAATADAATADAATADAATADAATADADVDYEPVYTNTGAGISTLATDQTYLYLGFYKGQGISRLGVGETTPTPLVTSAYPRALVTAGGNLYWQDNDGFIKTAPDGQVSQLGSNVAPGSSDYLVGQNGLVVSGGSLYWFVATSTTPTYSLVTASTGGTDGAAPMPLVTGITSPNSIAVDDGGGYIYYGKGGPTGGLFRTSLSSADGGAGEFVASAGTNAQIVNSSSIYWNEVSELWYLTSPSGSPTPGGIALSSQSQPRQVVVSDPSTVYFSTADGIFRATSSGTTKITADLRPTYFVLVGGSWVYWISSDQLNLRRAPM